MSSAGTMLCDRRAWLVRHVRTLAAVAISPVWVRSEKIGPRRAAVSRGPMPSAELTARQSEPLDPTPWQALAQQAVDAARAAGAQYADARLTRIIQHEYGVNGNPLYKDFRESTELIGVGVRALVQGYWGFAASAVPTSDEVARLAQDAVAQARENAQGPPRTVDLGHYPVATGTWATPIGIDPFTVPIEEKEDALLYWSHCADQAGIQIVPERSWLRFARHEQVVASTDGALFTQTRYESGGQILCGIPDGQGGWAATQALHDIDIAGAGWERLLDAQIPEQFSSGRLSQVLARKAAIPSKPSTIGKYTFVCDGTTMAALVQRTLGMATQLDRAFGYEANARGTSFLDDPLGMVGQAQVASPLVTLTANRSAPKDLATVKWDDEGVEPHPFTILNTGILTDFQTTREQAAWLAPYYQQHGLPVRSHGCANSEDAHGIPLQMSPNLSLEPGTAPAQLEDLIANVTDGILMEEGIVPEIDSQSRTGLLTGSMREIKNGRLGKTLTGGAVLFTSSQFWKSITAIGGPATQALVARTYPTTMKALMTGETWYSRRMDGKGQPPQLTSYSIRAVAATIPSQSLINPMRKA